jgi:aryl-alcohol dehydrogenase-like predicted oxidoreductase
MPWGPLLVDGTVSDVLEQIAVAHDATPQQVALAWLLQRSAVMAPIPGTMNVDHADANVDAAWLELTAADLAALSRP